MASKPGYGILVEQIINDGGMQTYLDAIKENARESRKEPGVFRFDVVLPEDAPDTVLLYELYIDEAAHHTHRETPHFKKFDAIRKTVLKSGRATRLKIADTDAIK